MYQKNAFIQAAMPVVALFVVISLAIIGFFIFSTLLLVGAVVGLIIYVVAMVRVYMIKRKLKNNEQPSSVIDVEFIKREDKEK